MSEGTPALKVFDKELPSSGPYPESHLGTGEMEGRRGNAYVHIIYTHTHIHIIYIYICIIFEACDF